MSAASQKRLRCVALRRDDQPCQAYASIGDRCVMHSERAAEIQASGGRATSTASRARRLLPARFAPWMDALERALSLVESGEMEPKVATAMATVVSVLCRAYQVGEIEERMREVERMAKVSEDYQERGMDWREQAAINGWGPHLVSTPTPAPSVPARQVEAQTAKQREAQRQAWQARNGAR